MQDAKVVPLLFDLKNSDVTGPLAQFQAQKVDQNGLLEILKSINQIAENSVPEDTISTLISALWPQFEEAIKNMPEIEASEKSARTQKAILEDLVIDVRSLSLQVREFDTEIDFGTGRRSGLSLRRIRPGMFLEMFHHTARDNNAVVLLVMAGVARSVVPWLSELLIEAYRNAKAGDFRSLMEVKNAINVWLHTDNLKMGRSEKLLYVITHDMEEIIDRIVHGSKSVRAKDRLLENDDLEF